MNQYVFIIFKSPIPGKLDRAEFAVVLFTNIYYMGQQEIYFLTLVDPIWLISCDFDNLLCLLCNHIFYCSWSPRSVLLDVLDITVDLLHTWFIEIVINLKEHN